MSAAPTQQSCLTAALLQQLCACFVERWFQRSFHHDGMRHLVSFCWPTNSQALSVLESCAAPHLHCTCSFCSPLNFCCYKTCLLHACHVAKLMRAFYT